MEQNPRIDLILGTADQIQQVRQLLSPGLILTDTATRNQTVRGLSRSFETSLTAFSMLVLFLNMPKRLKADQPGAPDNSILHILPSPIRKTCGFMLPSV